MVRCLQGSRIFFLFLSCFYLMMMVNGVFLKILKIYASKRLFRKGNFKYNLVRRIGFFNGNYVFYCYLLGS